MRKRRDLTGQTVASLKIGNSFSLKEACGQTKLYYHCVCECGVEKAIRADHILRGIAISCGCVGKKRRTEGSFKHGLSYNPLYFVWAAMMDRCYKTTFQDFHNYGGRGIEVSLEWHSVTKFVEDMTPGYCKGLQLDRIDNDGHYSKGNCHWVTRKENNRNKRTNVFVSINGSSATISEWAEISGLPYQTIKGRLKRGVTGENLISKTRVVLGN